MKQELDLYIKPGCPWCVLAVRYLRERGYAFREIDVIVDAAAFAQMVEISGQSKAPTLRVGEHVLPDFGPEELEVFLQKYNIEPTTQ